MLKSNWHGLGPTKLNVQQRFAQNECAQFSLFPVRQHVIGGWQHVIGLLMLSKITMCLGTYGIDSIYTQCKCTTGNMLHGTTHLLSALLLQPLLFCLMCCLGLQFLHYKASLYQLPGSSTEEGAEAKKKTGLKAWAGQPVLKTEKLRWSDRFGEESPAVYGLLLHAGPAEPVLPADDASPGSAPFSTHSDSHSLKLTQTA